MRNLYATRLVVVEADGQLFIHTVYTIPYHTQYFFFFSRIIVYAETSIFRSFNWVFREIIKDRVTKLSINIDFLYSLPFIFVCFFFFAARGN